jgi:PAS domain S-box-containing protein
MNPPHGVTNGHAGTSGGDRASTSPPSSSASWMESAKVPVLRIDRSETITGWNRRITEATGIRSDEILQKNLPSVIDASSYQRLHDNIHKVFSTGNAVSCNFVMASKNDIQLEFQVRVSAEKDASGQKIIGAVLVTEEIRAPKGSGAVGDPSSGRSLEDADDLMDIPMVRLDRVGTITSWNSEMANKTGISAEVALGQRFAKFLPSHEGKLERIMEKLRNGRKVRPCQVDIMGTRHGRRPHLLTFSSKRSSQSRVEGDFVSIVITDMDDISSSSSDEGENVASKQELSISDQQQQHKDKAEASQQDKKLALELRQLIDQANAPMFGVDTNGLINEWNDSIADISGLRREEMFGQSLLEASMINPALRSSIQKMIDNGLRGRSTSNVELEILTKMNEQRILFVNANSRRDTENNICGVFFIGQDITEASKHDRAMAVMANELRQLIDTANAPIFGIDQDG